MATKKMAQEPELPRIPLEPCASWADAEALARDALAYILGDPHEAAANRIKAAALVLDRARADGAVSAEAAGTLEDWLQVHSQSHL
jgi:hypothetical protein